MITPMSRSITLSCIVNWGRISLIMLILTLNTSTFLSCIQGCSPLIAQSTSEKYDSALMPVPPTKYLPEQLFQQLHANSNNAVEMFQIMRRAAGHGQMVAAFHILDDMRVKQPKNAVVQSSYCFTVNCIKGEYGPRYYAYSLTSDDYQHYDEALRQAYQADPDLPPLYVPRGM